MIFPQGSFDQGTTDLQLAIQWKLAIIGKEGCGGEDVTVVYIALGRAG